MCLKGKTLAAGQMIESSGDRFAITMKNLPTEGDILVINAGGRETLRVSREKDVLTASVLFTAKETPLQLQCHGAAKTLSLVHLGYKIVLLADGVLCDEEWPIGSAVLQEALCTVCGCDAEITENPEVIDYPEPETEFTGAQGWKPAGHNTSAGDCMPFAHGDMFHLFYLFDRRGHRSKWGLGAHQWDHISSPDLVAWRRHPMAISIDRQQEGSICTGSVFCHAGRYYAYYAVRSVDGSPAVLTWSESADGIRFVKSGKTFLLDAPFDGPSARDPKVFAGPDGKFHMLVTTSVTRPDGSKRGCLARLVSEDLTSWTQCPEPFVVLEIEDQPECPDHFFFDGLYYLVYSNFGMASYYFSENPFGPWRSPGQNRVCDDGLRVPKAAVWKNRLIFVGFRYEDSYGGPLSFHEARRRPDGSLDFFAPFEMRGNE